MHAFDCGMFVLMMFKLKDNHRWIQIFVGSCIYCAIHLSHQVFLSGKYLP